MKTDITLTVRAFPVLIRDERTGEQLNDMIVLTKEQLRAADLVGESSKELIYRQYNREGFTVQSIGKAVKRAIVITLDADPDGRVFIEGVTGA